MLNNNISRMFHQVGFMLQKHSPELLVATGIASGVAGAVVACRATLKVEEVLKEKKELLDKVKDVRADKELSKKYSDEDERKDIVSIYAKTGFKLIKLYAPALLLGTLSISCILGSHNILRKRNLALASAYASISTSFNEYRKRMAEAFGKDKELELRHNIKDITRVNPETDKEENIRIIGEEKEYSDYARYFDESNPNFSKNSQDYNHMFLKSQQAYANNLLQAKGYLYLNDVYDLLGMSRTKAGQVIGWKYDKKKPIGDNYVDFGIYDNNCFLDKSNHLAQTVILDFNVDGNIWETEIDY